MARRRNSDSDEQQTEQPERPVTADAPDGDYGDPEPARSEDYPERTYADALSDQHAQVLRDAGQHPDPEG